MHHVGVLAYGSLLTSPGPELNEATAMRIEGVVTHSPWSSLGRRMAGVTPQLWYLSMKVARR